MSSHLNWLIVRNNHAFLYKKRNVQKPFSSEPGNLRNINSLRHNGFLNKKAVHIAPEPQGKGIVLSFKAGKYQRKPAKNLQKTTLKHGPRRSLMKLKRWFECNQYRQDLTMPALRRASCILKSQKPQPVKSKRRVRRVGKAGKNSKSGKGAKKTE
ncbi:UNVERIFIED_CONTAM: hypothetical protein RMT77_003996 [Armadillidium vulgare]|nr:60S ribosomal protein L28 [Armadillidium vulgare]